MFKTLTSIPSLKTTYKSSLNVILRQQVQPWHPTSTLTHEAALAVLKVSPEKYWSFSAALFDAQTEYFDISVVNETRNQTYARLAKLAGSVGVDEKAVLDLLTIPDKPGQDGALNSGNGVTVDLKWVIKVFSLSPALLFLVSFWIEFGGAD